ncbi:MAG: nucleotide exchange factor GrpE [Candidatus Aminicenantia bacterium]
MNEEIKKKDERKGEEIDLKGEEKSEEKKEDIEIIKNNLESLKKEKEELYNRYIRAIADMDNFKKRVEKQKKEFYNEVLSEILFSMLPILDDFERALANQTEQNEAFIRGIELIYKNFKETLFKFGLKPIEALGLEFNPFYHEAIFKVDSEEVDRPMVIEVFQKGYLLNDKLLRPSLVRVAVPVEKPGGEEEKIGENCRD